MSQEPAKRLLAVASCGGHWIQLMRLRAAFEGVRVTYVSTRATDRRDVGGCAYHAVVDANRNTKIRLVVQLLQVAWIVLRARPDAVISTGATVGYFACRLGKLVGARVIWVDSIANAEQLSLSGRKAGAFADTWLTQWEHLASEPGPTYDGAVL
ncbi:MAG: UDP-N-acetylglucosamine--LPS N-acetylglucosamine transferase [Planctomycetota bacterium]